MVEDRPAARARTEDPLADSDFQIGLTLMETGQWLAVDSLVGDYGEGDTCADAVRDLVVSLFEDRDLLRERKDALAEPLAQQLGILEASLNDEML